MASTHSYRGQSPVRFPARAFLKDFFPFKDKGIYFVSKSAEKSVDDIESRVGHSSGGNSPTF
ncbi:hypothetical protein FJZ22_02565 [Candidatus Pacearchaeota archaeon]|nr:hypothetical protein [Candidatus Pacearchaeota archaeon]